MQEVITQYGANPGRSGHQLAKKAGDVIFEARVKLSQFFGQKNPQHVIFYPNATYALNQAILGFPFEKGDHVITTTLEHNSVRRPLEYLKRTVGIHVSYIEPNHLGLIDGEKIKQEIFSKTKAIVVTHGSNVTGAITPIEEIGEIAHKHDVYFIVDASQTAGVLPIDMEAMHIDCLAFPGHKGLLGPQGTGVLIVKDPMILTPLIYGGTGGFSELVGQPEKSPERFESGTLNTPGIAGLLAGVKEVEHIGLDEIFAHEWGLTKHLIQELQALKAVEVFGPPLEEHRLAVVPFQINGLDAHEAATIFDQHYQIGVRAGLHCAPMIHETLGTIATGSIRASFGYYNTIDEVNRLIEAIKEVQTYFTS